MVLYLPPMISDELSEDEMDQVAGGGIGDFCREVKKYFVEEEYKSLKNYK